MSVAAPGVIAGTAGKPARRSRVDTGMLYRLAALAALLSSACIVVTEAAAPVSPGPPGHVTPRPSPSPSPPPPRAETCRAAGPVLYRETRRPLGNDAVARESLTIYRSGAFAHDQRHGCLSGAQMAELEAGLTAARLAPEPQVTCMAMPHVEITVEIDAVGAVAWKAPCSRTADAETLRGVALARRITGG